MLKSLKTNDFAQARDYLIGKMAEYQAFTGYRVIIVFDAHLVKGIEKKYVHRNVEIIFTRENETADERIEKMARKLKNIHTQIHVATSDFTEQWSIFSQGALRISARELLTEVESIEKGIHAEVNKRQETKPSLKITLSDEIVKIFEKWRREGR